MLDRFSKNQNWARLTPWLGAVSLLLLIWFFKPSDAEFWALINIPLYLFHQFEEHYWPGGFKSYMNTKIYGLPKGQEKLTDRKVFWVNILLVWIAFALFGALTAVSLGFGLLIIVFSIMNCLTHIFQGIKRREWNPGLVMASVQFLVSLYAAYFISSHGLTNGLAWWVGSIVFSAAVHAALFRFIMSK